jgi:hypothetical protein
VRFAETGRFTLRMADATTDLATRFSRRRTLTAARISEALAFLKDIFAGRRAEAFFVFVVTTLR